MPTGNALVGKKVSVKYGTFYSGCSGKVVRYEGNDKYIIDVGDLHPVLHRSEFMVDSMKRKKKK